MASSYYQKFVDYMEKDTKGVEIGIYAISGIVFAVAYHKIRPITKFVKPTDIPRHFIRDKLKQNGIINGIEPSINSGPLLRVNHKPPINLMIFSKKTVPVKLAGVDINSNGYSWLQSVTINKKIRFIPITINHDNIECQVLMLSAFPKKPDLDLGDALISLGFAKATPLPRALTNDKILLHYYKCLNSTENRAKRKRVGLWLTSLPPPSWPMRLLRNAVGNAITAITPPGKRLPQLVR